MTSTLTTTSPAPGPAVHTTQALRELLEANCRFDEHLVLHDQHQQVWVAYPDPGGGFVMARPLHPTAVDPATHVAWLDELVIDVGDLPSWRFPLTVLFAPPRAGARPSTAVHR